MRRISASGSDAHILSFLVLWLANVSKWPAIGICQSILVPAVQIPEAVTFGLRLFEIQQIQGKPDKLDPSIQDR